MTGKVINDNYARLDGSARQARRIYLDAWLRWGFSLLLLHKRTKDGECCCSPGSESRRKDKATYQAAVAAGKVAPCGNKGKHLVSKAARSIARTVEEVEDHLDDGGSIGLALRMSGVPAAPVALVVFDCDKPDAEAWLGKRVPLSPLASRGRVGMHDYRVIPDDVPPLKSDTSSLNPGRKFAATEEQPGIDVKVSGLVVMAYSQNKTLWWRGQDISSDPIAVAAVFGGSLGDFLNLLPHTDPRTVAPLMREHGGASNAAPLVPAAPGVAQGTSKGAPATAPLSADRPARVDVQGALHNVAYNHRKRLAGAFLMRAQPAVEGKNPDGAMFRVIVTLIRHYALSEIDTFKMVKKGFNDRCLDSKGAPYPYGDRQLRHMIEGARNAEYDPIGVQDAPGFEDDSVAMRANHARRDRRSNARRNRNRKEDRAFEQGCIMDFLATCCAVTKDEGDRVEQRALYDACIDWVKAKWAGALITDNRIGRVLKALGIKETRVGHDQTRFRMGIALEKSAAA